MINELAKLVDDFPGSANQTRRFFHILNLIVKSIIQQFDVPTSNKLSDGNDVDESVDEGTEELLKLAGDIDFKEEITAGAGDEDDVMNDDNNERWVDKHEGRSWLICQREFNLVFTGPVWSGFLTQKWATGNCNWLPNSEISKNWDHNRFFSVSVITSKNRSKLVF